ncbi:MAG: hypothetical protein GXO20_06265 [Thermodesulfobacteria bacterium]|nr:hypothetical protein [Thermodesulfobacteriota bacterium]
MKRFAFVLVLVAIVWFTFAKALRAEVLSTEEKELYAAYFFVEKKPPTTLGYIFTDFGPGNINFLERIDIVLDKEGRVTGVLIVYTPTDGFRRQVFLPRPHGWVFQEVRPNAKGKKIVIRTVTSSELGKIR